MLDDNNMTPAADETITEEEIAEAKADEGATPEEEAPATETEAEPKDEAETV